jgi:hypothetical protein
MEAKSNARIAFALLMGLAVCCTVMYVTSDGAESIYEVKYVGSGFDLKFPRENAGPANPATIDCRGGSKQPTDLQSIADCVQGQMAKPRSIESVDVKKSATIYTDTPDGRMRLKTYLTKVENLIAKEVASRTADIKAIRAKMAKNFAFNKAARSSMKKMLLAKMAVNAKKAKDDLAKDMREVQAKFAAQAAADNKRNKANIRRSKKLRTRMRKNKAQAAKKLAMAVHAQQAALSALDSATNARIKKTEKSIAANGAQIKANAEKARKDLEKAMGRFDKKMANVNAEAKKARSKLVAQAAAQDKAFRNMANNKIKEIAAHTAAQFAKVRKKMAEDRHHADLALKHASSRMDAALSASKALQDKRFKQTVADIKAAKKEANDRVAAAKTSFKTDLLNLQGTVKTQVSKMNQAVNTLQGTVEHNKLMQAKVDRNVHAELGRMVKLGNDRYTEHLNKDKELKSLLAKNKEETANKMRRLSDTFMEGLGKIKKQMKKDREAQAHALKGGCDALYKTMADNMEAQDKANKAQMAATAQVGADAEDALNDAKADFAQKLAKMHAVAVESAKRQEGKILKLTGIVEENALKDKKGREQLKKMSNSNKNELEHAVSEAIHKGEQRAMQIEQRQKGANAKMRQSMNQRISTEIGELRKETQKALYTLSLETKEARAMMRKQVEHALKDAMDEAKKNLADVVKWSTGRFAALDAVLEGNQKASAGDRAKLQSEIDAEKADAATRLQNAVDAQGRARIAFAEETNNSVEATNKNIDAAADQMAANAKKVAADIKTDTAAIVAKIAAAKKAANTGLATAEAASVNRYKSALKAVETGLANAEAKSTARFGKLYEDMAADRKSWDHKYATSMTELNDAIASEAALQSEQFTHNMKDIASFKVEARKRVSQARKSVKTSITGITAVITDQAKRVNGEIAVVSGMVRDNAAQNAQVNMKVAKGLDAIEKASDQELSKSTRFHKELKIKVDANKAAASEEVQALTKKVRFEVSMMRSKQAEYRLQAAQALTQKTEDLYDAMAKQATDDALAKANMAEDLKGAAANTASKLGAAQEDFKAKLNTLTNIVTANNKKYEHQMEEMTGVVHDWQQASDADRALLKDQVSTMEADLNGAIARAIQLGEAKMKETYATAHTEINGVATQALTIMSERIEDMADDVFGMVQGNRQVIADNYLSLKAYAIAAKDELEDYVTKGKGRNLGSIGDMLETIANLEHVKVGKSEGIGAGSDVLPKIFSGDKIKITNPVNKINFLVDEAMQTFDQVSNRWTMGLGKYLLGKVEKNMQKKGVLEVDHIEGKDGNFVFINAAAVGLSSKLSDFETLAVKMVKYQHTLAHLTAHAKQKKQGAGPAEKQIVVNPPEWDGD